QEEQHLGITVVRRKRPAVAEHDRLTRAPVLVEDLDPVLCRDGRHGAIVHSPIGVTYSAAMKFRTSVFAVALLAASFALAAPPAPEVQTQASQSAMTPAQALEKLKAGNARFVANKMQPRNWSGEVSATASGQYPFAAVLACMDSRAPIEVIFD